MITQSMTKLEEHPMTGLFDRLTIKVFLRFLAMSKVDFWCIHAKGKQTREMDTALSKRDRS